MIDFSKIHSFDLGQRTSFEELVCQLSRYEKFQEKSVYKRVEGAGGDGGIEAYWTKPNGKKTGYQAKYFLRSGDIKWSQLDKSVEQALITHPELECYVFALPCDLTDKSGAKGRGKSGWEHWDTRVTKWKKKAQTLGFDEIEFKVWTNSELLARTLEIGGIREYFFGDIELSRRWFSEHVEVASSMLGERFHPEDHVDVGIEKLFSVISRPSEHLGNLLALIKKEFLPDREYFQFDGSPKKSDIDEVKNAFAGVLKFESYIDIDLQHDWIISDLAQASYSLLDSIDVVLSWFRKYERPYTDTSKKGNESKELKKFLKKLQSFRYSVYRLHDFLNSDYMEASNQSIGFVQGIAGSGKSHLLARAANNAIKSDQPVVFLLGQQFNDNNLSEQIGGLLHLTGRTLRQVLSALEIAGKAAKAPALLLIDAINEGAGSKFWHNNISSLITEIQRFTHIRCIISCRSEYFDLALPTTILNEYPTFEVRGFVTAKEQAAAAKVYLDRRGISRPSNPWLSPEFINPLFLRAVCVSLERDGKSEFPKGLAGTKKLLKYYLDSIGREISIRESSSTSLVSKLGRAVIGLAGRMLDSRKDYLELDDCRQLISSEFENIRSKTEADWLSVFLNNGLLRKDPNPSPIDIFSDEDVVRFSYQRFQDFFMAEYSLEAASTGESLFVSGGPLSFCINDGKLMGQWYGLLAALATLLPEKLSVELFDTLPGGLEVWSKNHSLQNFFLESLQWRGYSAFSDRTLELLNTVAGKRRTDALELLIKVAISQEHPWNACFLHKNLKKRSLPERDKFWTMWVNHSSNNDSDSVFLLIDWCMNGQYSNTHLQNQRLASLVLCWFFTSSNRLIRDKSTKALSNLFKHRKELFEDLLDKFIDTDDLYILERLLASAYSVCCIDPSPERLNQYSLLVFEKVFKNGNPPFGVLLRDYALGIVDLARSYAVLSSEVDFDLCSPPYNSSVPILNVTREEVEQIASAAGGNDILYSAANSMGDFANYEISPRIGNITNVFLADEQPLSQEQRFGLFKAEVLATDDERWERFEILEFYSNTDNCRFSNYSSENWEELKASAQHIFFMLLDKKEVERFHSEAAPYLYDRKYGDDASTRFSGEEVQRWVAKRAYEYGWTEKMFKHESSETDDYTRNRPNTERIGKKYQWLALDELLSRLTDNFWIKKEYGGYLPQHYKNPLDLSFIRDIDPTVIDERSSHQVMALDVLPNSWEFHPFIELEKVPEESLTKWPFERNPANSLKSLPVRTDNDGVEWLVLYEHQSTRETYEDVVGHRVGEHSQRVKEFRFLETALVMRSDVKTIVKKMENKGFSGGAGWAAKSVTNEVFLKEAHWRDIWDNDKWLSDNSYLPDDIKHAQLIADFYWEPHLDKSLPDGFSTYMPLPWLIKKLNLSCDKAHSGMWCDSSGSILFRDVKGEEGARVCLLMKDVADSIAGNEYTFLTTLIAERNSWPQGSNSSAAWRRTEGVRWRDERGVNARSWHKDRKN